MLQAAAMAKKICARPWKAASVGCVARIARKVWEGFRALQSNKQLPYVAMCSLGRLQVASEPTTCLRFSQHAPKKATQGKSALCFTAHYNAARTVATIYCASRFADWQRHDGVKLHNAAMHLCDELRVCCRSHLCFYSKTRPTCWGLRSLTTRQLYK